MCCQEDVSWWVRRGDPTQDVVTTAVATTTSTAPVARGVPAPPLTARRRGLRRPRRTRAAQASRRTAGRCSFPKRNTVCRAYWPSRLVRRILPYQDRRVGERVPERHTLCPTAPMGPRTNSSARELVHVPGLTHPRPASSDPPAADA